MSSRDSVVAWPLGDRTGGEPGGEGGPVGSHWLSLADIGRRLGVPAGDVRDYIEHHGAFIEVMHFGQRTLVGRGSLPTLEAIRRCYERGADAEGVNQEMARRRGRTRGTAAAAARGEVAAAETTAVATAAPAAPAAARDVVLPTYEVANEIIGLRREVAEVRRTMGALTEALAARDEALRTVLSALAELVATQDNERRLAEGERDRQNASEHRQTLDAVNELLGVARRRGRWRL